MYTPASKAGVAFWHIMLHSRVLFSTLLATALVFLPSVVFATTLGDILVDIRILVGKLIPVVFGLSLLAFFWGLALFLMNFSGEEKDKKKGRELMMYGVITLFVAFTVWGLVSLLATTFGIDPNAPPITVPSVP